MNSGLAFFGGLFVFVYLIVLWLWIRKPLLGRLALREGVRRPGQTALVVGGLMVGAAGITAALVGSDSARESSVLNAYRSWGVTDLTVEAGDEVFPERIATELADDPALQPYLDGVGPGLEVVGSVSDRTKKESDSGVRLIGFDPATQRQFGAFTLTDGSKTYLDDLGDRGVLLSRQLADELRAEVGDTIVLGVQRLEKPKPSPKGIGKKIKDVVRELKDLQKEAERKAEAAAGRAGESAARAVVAAAAQQALSAGIPPPAPQGPVPSSVPPAVVPPEPDPAAVQAQAKAAAQAAGQQAAAQVGKRYEKRAKDLQKKLERLQDDLEDAIDDLKPIKLRVAGIARSEGPGAYGLISSVFAPLSLAQEVAHTDEINVVRLSANGDTQTGLATAEKALPDVKAAVESLDAGKGVDLRVREVKQKEIDAAADSTEFTYAMLVGMSTLVLAAGIALVINLTQMLAEERRPRLGVLRALGLTRRGLVTLSVLEGALYSLMAAAVGTTVGLFAGRVIAIRFGKAFAEFFGAEVDFKFVFSLKPATLATAFAAGALVTLGTLFFTSWRTSRLSIPAAIRNLPEPAREPRRRRWPRAIALLALFGLGIAGLAGGDREFGRLMGGVATVVLIASLTRSRVPERLHASVYGLALAGWSFYMVRSISTLEDPNKFFAVFTASVLVSVIGLSMVASANLRVVESLGALSRRMRATLRPPLAYLARRRMRTGLSIIMFAVVMAIISMFSSFLYIFQPHYERDSLGYDVVVAEPKKKGVDLPKSVRDEVDHQADIVTKVYTGPMDSQFADVERSFLPLYAFSDEQFADPPMRLSGREETFDSDAEVWRAVAASGSKWVVSDFGNPGDELILEGENRDVTYEIAGNPGFGLFRGITASENALEKLDTVSTGHTVLLALKPGVDADDVAHEIERARFKKGVNADTTRELMERGYRANRTLFSVIDVLMKMGLVVGILSLGILALRAVVERRHVIGVLRAIGFRKRGVMAGLLVEAGATTTLGVAVGCLAGILMAWIFFTSFFEESVFGIEWPTLRGSILLVYISVLLVTIGPAWRASRLPPAEAVRYTE
ncbi:MAG: FtsX-like permease family protein [Actinomycetota bacterium]